MLSTASWVISREAVLQNNRLIRVYSSPTGVDKKDAGAVTQCLAQNLSDLDDLDAIMDDMDGKFKLKVKFKVKFTRVLSVPFKFKGCT